MCGIAGLIGHYDDSELLEKLTKMCQLQAHRGPDYQDVIVQNGVGLGHNRLAIRDLSANANQPFWSPCRRYALVFNGEIYNTEDLKRSLGNHYVYNTCSDTEVLLYAYIAWGSECLKQLDGMFAFAIYDWKEKTVFLARDHAGIKPLFYTDYQESFGFSSEYLALSNAGIVPKEVDMSALYTYLTVECVPSPKSINPYIKKLPPAHYGVYKDGQLTIQKYWDICTVSQSSTSLSEGLLDLDNHLSRSVKTRLQSDVPLGCFLSGGIDSSLITALSRHSFSGLHTFNVDFEEQGYSQLNEAKEVSRHLDVTMHHRSFTYQDFENAMSIVFPKMGEPLADSSLFPTWFLCRLAKEKVTVALSGDGADELCAGYPTYLAHRLTRFLPKTNLWRYLLSGLPSAAGPYPLQFKLGQWLKGVPYSSPIRNMLWLGAFSISEKRDLFKQEILEQVDTTEETKEWESTFSEPHHSDVLSRLLYQDYRYYLQEKILYKVDLASMWNSLEVRVPFLSTDMISYLYSVPSSLKLKGTRPKFMLRELGKQYLPKTAVHRVKKGFGLPIATWLNGPLKAHVKEVLCDTSISEWFNRPYIDRLCEEHWSGKRNHWKSIWTLFVFQKWRYEHNY